MRIKVDILNAAENVENQELIVRLINKWLFRERNSPDSELGKLDLKVEIDQS